MQQLYPVEPQVRDSKRLKEFIPLRKSIYPRFLLSALLLALLLLPKPILAQSADTPLPLPDLLIYGIASEENGQPTTGSVTVQLPRGHVITTPIDEVSGTEYGFVLPVPISMYAPNATNFAKDSAIQGETISFLVNNRPAFLQAPDGSTIPNYKIPTGGFGHGQLVELIIAGPDRYTAGDVNANGPRDAADAMLALKYDIGLIFGSQEFPPPPAQIYLPLCDIVEDGACDSGDALRILQCDVGRTDVDCPTGMVSEGSFAGATPQLAASEVRLRKAVTAAAAEDDELITLAVMLEDSTNQFGALSATVAYDRNLLTPVRCDANPAQALDMGICNLEYDENRVRFNAFTTTSTGNNGPLVELTFRRATSAANNEADEQLFTLEETSVYDGSGTQIAWSAPQVTQPETGQPDTGQPDTEQPSQSSTTIIFMPLLQNGNPTVSAASTTENRAQDESGILYMPIVAAEESLNAVQVKSAAADEVNGQEEQPAQPQPKKESAVPHQVDADRRVYLPSILNGSE